MSSWLVALLPTPGSPSLARCPLLLHRTRRVHRRRHYPTWSMRLKSSSLIRGSKRIWRVLSPISALSRYVLTCNAETDSDRHPQGDLQLLSNSINLAVGAVQGMQNELSLIYEDLRYLNDVMWGSPVQAIYIVSHLDADLLVRHWNGVKDAGRRASVGIVSDMLTAFQSGHVSTDRLWPRCHDHNFGGPGLASSSTSDEVVEVVLPGIANNSQEEGTIVEMYLRSLYQPDVNLLPSPHD